MYTLCPKHSLEYRSGNGEDFHFVLSSVKICPFFRCTTFLFLGVLRNVRSFTLVERLRENKTVPVPVPVLFWLVTVLIDNVKTVLLMAGL